MQRGAVPPHPSLPTVLVVAAGTGENGAVARAVNAAADSLLVTHALTLAAALRALSTGTFDCVLVDAGGPGLSAADLAKALRGPAGSAALVVVDPDPANQELEDTADLVLAPRDLHREWLRPLGRTIEHGRLRLALRAAESRVERLSGIVESVTDAVFTTTTEGVVTGWNNGAELLYGYPSAEIVGAHVSSLHPPGSDEPRRIMAMIHEGKSVLGLDTLRRTRDGRLAEVTMNVTPLADDDGELAGAVIVARDISDRLELEAELVRVTMHDALTGLPNRSYLTYRLSQALSDARNGNREVAVLHIDLDQFKAVDDVYGHVLGDRVLARVAERLRALAGPTDIVSRVGGDEFVFVCPDVGVEEAGEFSEQVLAAIAEPIAIDGRGLRVGASIGIAVAPPLEFDTELLLKHADAAMTEAKARGRARSQLFDPALTRRAGEQNRLANDLREAIAHDLLEVHFQPVMGLASDQVVGVEALARWEHPELGTVSPGVFVPLAETHGIAAELDRWVLDRACHETVDAIDSGLVPPTFHVAVNLSARSLDDPRLVDVVDDVVRRSGLEPGSLVLEITETALLHNRDAARATIDGLRDLGVGVALDDFGTGYSSLSFLRELPVTVVKIDRSFVRDAVERPEDLAITEAIVRLANGLGLQTVAEGVETVEQRDLLRRLGCESAQGFLWSGAVPMASLPDKLLGDRARARVARLREPNAARFSGERRVATPRRRVLEAAAAAEHTTACCLRGGLEAGQSWLVVSTPDRREAFARSLGSLHGTAVANGQLVELDAYETLRKVTGSDGRLDATRFENVVGTALRALGTASDLVGVHAELGHVTQPLLSLRVSTDLRRQLHTVGQLTLEYGDHPADCAGHGERSLQQLGLVDGSATA
ncbi:bifunctional diguanylate cyclase/phosphodiesterase [Nocardioides sp. SR21]|uniref:putative bifunctional diguanylate cyclase/phosphodiesterase n=1 Tax=Nocardioides sp. SR21 TaxID=2919501 RepID=UPI001FA94428|nr:EAL domain-containing protein [Nocardioides sp. SR21]